MISSAIWFSNAVNAAIERQMPKAPTITKLPKGLKGTKVPTHRLNTKTGQLEPIRKKLTPPAKYAQKTRQKWRAAR